MPRTLLPTFSAFKALADIYKEEDPETFAWLPADIRYDYDLAKEALNQILGSREWLKAYTYDEAEGAPFCNPMGYQILSAFGSHHSGYTATRLAWNYKALLNDWDSFVLQSKESFAREEYDRQQLTRTDIQTFIYSRDAPDRRIKEVNRLRALFNIQHDYETTYAMLMELAEEKSREAVAQEEKERCEYFEGRIGILKHHYKHPSRWNDTEHGSSLFGPIQNITEDMMVEMESLYPDYREHIASLKGGA